MPATLVATEVSTALVTTAVPVTPAGTAQEADLAVLLVVRKPTTATVTTPTSWTFLRSAPFPSAGVALHGILYTRTVPTGTFTWPATMNTSSSTTGIGVISMLYRPNPGGTLSVGHSSGSNDVADTTFSATPPSVDPGLTAGDLVAVLSGLSGSTPAFDSPTLSAPGVTINAPTEVYDAAVGTVLRYALHTSAVTAGTSTAPPTFAATLSDATNAIGGSLFLRVRSTGGTTPPAAARRLFLPF